LLRFLGGPAASLLLLAVGLTLWIAVPMALAQKLLKKQDL
jgi:hypothetical protein